MYNEQAVKRQRLMGQALHNLEIAREYVYDAAYDEVDSEIENALEDLAEAISDLMERLIPCANDDQDAVDRADEFLYGLMD